MTASAMTSRSRAIIMLSGQGRWRLARSAAPDNAIADKVRADFEVQKML